MNLHLKTSLILLATLIIGFVLGIVSTGWFVNNRIRKQFSGPERYQGIMMRIIDPSEDQEERLKAILDSAQTRFRTINDNHRGQMAVLQDSVRSEMAEILTPEQLARLDKHIQRVKRRRPFGPRGDNDRPPGPPRDWRP